MSNLEIALVYFSATNVTRSYANVIGQALREMSCRVDLIDVTAYTSRQKPLLMNRFDAFIFGFPVFSDFAPSVINEWIPSLDGKGKRCAIFLTYGARTTGYAHFHTKVLLEKARFQVLFSVEFLGRHSFNVGGWKILSNRPDESDFAVAREYAHLAKERFEQKEPPIFHLQKPFSYNKVLRFLEMQPKKTGRTYTNPVRQGNECSMCRICESECPSLAFQADSGLSDPNKCIQCMHCVYICPDKVVKIDERMKYAYQGFLEDWHMTEEMISSRKSRLITEYWQAAF